MKYVKQALRGALVVVGLVLEGVVVVANYANKLTKDAHRALEERS